MYQLGCENLCFFLSERRLKGGAGVFPWEAFGRQDRMRERESYREIIWENIDYDILTQDEKLDRDRLDELVELMVDTVCSNREMIRVAGGRLPRRGGEVPVLEDRQLPHRVCAGTDAGEHHPGPQYQEISAGGAV